MANADPRFAAAARRLEARHREAPDDEELGYARAVTRWVERLRPDPSPALALAARAQHLGRWRVPRDTYPANRPGYLRWRADLQVFHADQTADILRDCGFEDAFVERVGALMRKEGLGDDPETQALEDALCLAFMERQLAAFSTRHAEPKMQRILEKTWQKMSPAARELALTLELPERVRSLVMRSVG